MTKKLQLKCTLCAILVISGLFFNSRAVAASDKTPSETWEQRAIEGNVVVSEWLDEAADFIDLFLAGKRVTRKRNETSVRIENSSIWKDGNGYNNSTAFNVSLRLPNVEEYWKLKFTSYDENQDRRATQNAQYRTRAREQNYGASVGFFQSLGRVRAAFQPRVELQDPLKISHLLSFETDVQMSESSEFNPKVEFFAYPDRGTGVYTHFNFAFQLNDIYSFGLINQTNYEDKNHEFAVANGIVLSRPVMKTAGIAYSFFLNSNNQTKYHLESYSLAVTWSQILYKNILEYNITPHWDFEKPNAYTGRGGVNFNVNLKF